MIKTGSQGNVLFIVLIGVALLAALTMAISDSERYTDTMDAEDIKVQLQEIYDYAHEIENAISFVLLHNNCEISQLNFDHPDLLNYNTTNYYLNPNSPTDGTCDIFDASGGGVEYREPPQMSQDQGGYEYGVMSRFPIEAIGSSASDLILHTLLPEDACIRLNNTQGVSNPSSEPPVMSDFNADIIPYITTRSFPSSAGWSDEGFSTGVTLGSSSFVPEVEGHKTFCVKEDENGLYHFFYVLLAR